MKIVFFTLLKSSSWGGSENLWFKTANLALEEGHKVLIVAESTLDTKKIISLKNAGAEIFYLENHLKTYKDRLFQLISASFAEKKFLNKLNNIITQFSPDLMVINQPGCYDIVFNKTISNFLKSTSKKYVVCFHSYIKENVLKPAEVSTIGNILTNAVACFFVAKKQAATILQQLNISITNTNYIANPLNLINTSYIAYPKDNNFSLAMISSLDMNWKGHDVVLNILAKPSWLKKDWSLDIFGSGIDFKEIEELIDLLQLTGRVNLKGHVKDIREIWSTHQILLMPSRVDAAPAVLLEAMACGRPAVCTNIGFVEDWIKDNVNGFIAEDTSLFEEALDRAWTKSTHWEEMGKLANEQVISTFPSNPGKQFLEKLSYYCYLFEHE